MIKIFILCSVLILTFASDGFSQSKHSRAANKVAGRLSKLIGLVDNGKRQYLSGCGCSLMPASMRRGQKYYFLTELDDAIGKKAWMNIDGRVVKLSLKSTTARASGERKGSIFTQVYKGGGVAARIVFVVTKENPPGGEVTFYSAVIKVTKGNRTQTVKAIGDCGC